MVRKQCLVSLTGFFAIVSTVSAVLAESVPQPIDYNRQIRPILSDKCFACHGPDEAARESGLRLDRRDDALRPSDSGKAAIVPEKPDASKLVARIESTDPGEMMPPPESNKSLTPAEKALLRQWVAEGAKYQQHWAFATPRQGAIPAVKDRQWPRNDLDRFILARLEAEGLKHSPEADRATLIRRVTLDLTGLPPTPAEVDAYLADKSPQAYEKVVDRLLSNPHYGERMAVDWLDAARYADTHGYHIDSGRDMTRWREWVIDAFNKNLPFDQFTVEQLAGDLLPNATREQLIASGFNRNHMINFEGGAIPEEYHAAYIIDRVNTTGTVWLGLTVGCSQCHDHKYDPLSQREFYQLYAFFHNVPENGLDGTKGNAAPMIKAPSEDQEQRLANLAKDISQVGQDLAGKLPEVDEAQAEWELAALATSRVDWKPLRPLEVVSAGGATMSTLEDLSLLATGENPAVETYVITAQVAGDGLNGLRLEALPDDSLSAKGPGRSSNGNIVLTDVRVSVRPADGPEAEPRDIKLWSASADFSQKDFSINQAIDADLKSGWGISPEFGRKHTAVFELQDRLSVEGDVLLTITLDFQSIYSQHQLGRFRLSTTTSKDPHGEQAVPESIAQILETPAANRTDKQQTELRTWYRANISPTGRRLNERLTALKLQQQQLDALIPTAMVMREMERPRDTFLLVRGQYDKKGDQVTAGVPAFLPALPPEAPANRLGLARWLVSPEHPLTARVTVNRYWQMFFGMGLVKTSEDFGLQGESPSHPELLDWLAAEFSSSVDRSGNKQVESNQPSHRAWDVKGLVRLIVTSATYRQSSAVSRESLARDPENRLLGRGPRFRLQAEFIRDQALAVSGLLDPRIGGKSVSPYQPAGLWEELMSREDGKNWTAQSYEQSHGADLYRRTMYTFWKRTCPPPTLSTFDAPDRETCTVRRARTNTPLQALVLLNDPTYVEAARKFAERILTDGGASTEERINFAFRHVLGRSPSPREQMIVRSMLEGQQAKYARDRQAAEKLLSVGEAPRNAQLDAAELAAWASVASALLNLDEAVTRG